MDYEPFQMEYTLDEAGQTILLKEGKHQVMMAWEQPYMEACIDALQPFGDVLEVGFGCGYSASHIQSYFPKSHTIIECHPQVCQRALSWACDFPSARIVQDTWQNALDHLGVYDAIFFDDYPLHTEGKIQEMEQQEAQSEALLQKTNELIDSVILALPGLKVMRYRDEDLCSFFLEHKEADPSVLSRFLQDLVCNAQIDERQKKKVMDLLKGQGVFLCSQEKSSHKKKNSPFAFHRKGDRFFEFLEKCLQQHMRKGSRFSCYLNSPVSKYEDKVWFEHIITNPFLDYEERRIQVDVPKHCNYYSFKEALVITVTKK